MPRSPVFSPTRSPKQSWPSSPTSTPPGCSLSARGIGYRLLGTVVGGRTVVKDKQKIDTPGMDPAARRRHLAGFYDFADIGDTITTLRRCDQLEWRWVSDGRTDEIDPTIAIDAAGVKKQLRAYADQFGPDILHDQDVYVECWCEAADLARLVAGLLEPYGISVYSGSGDIPVPAVRYAALRYWAELSGRTPGRRRRRVVVLIIGDFDIDGLENADRFVEDTEAFIRPEFRGRIDWRWVAPRPEHLTRWDATLRPAAGPAVVKPGRMVPATLQAEALIRDDILRTILTESVEGILDMDQVEATRENWDAIERPLIDSRAIRLRYSVNRILDRGCILITGSRFGFFQTPDSESEHNARSFLQVPRLLHASQRPRLLAQGDVGVGAGRPHGDLPEPAPGQAHRRQAAVEGEGSGVTSPIPPPSQDTIDEWGPRECPFWWPEVAGVHVGSCIEDGRRFRHQAHAHTRGEHKGWICVLSHRRIYGTTRDEKGRWLPTDKPSRLMVHEYAHILTGHGHDDVWRAKMRELGQPIPAHYKKRRRGRK